MHLKTQDLSIVLEYQVTVPPPTNKDVEWMKFAQSTRVQAGHTCNRNSALVQGVLKDKELSDKLSQAGKDNEERAKHHGDLVENPKPHVYYLNRNGYFKKDGRNAKLQTKLLNKANNHLIPTGRMKNGKKAGDRIKAAKAEYAHALDHGPNGHCHRENCEGKEQPANTVFNTHSG